MRCAALRKTVGRPCGLDTAPLPLPSPSLLLLPLPLPEGGWIRQHGRTMDLLQRDAMTDGQVSRAARPLPSRQQRSSGGKVSRQYPPQIARHIWFFLALSSHTVSVTIRSSFPITVDGRPNPSSPPSWILLIQLTLIEIVIRQEQLHGGGLTTRTTPRRGPNDKSNSTAEA